MRKLISQLITAGVLTTALAAQASPNLVVNGDTIIGSIDNINDYSMRLVNTDVLSGVAELQMPSIIYPASTANYQIKLYPDTQVRLTYQDVSGNGCRITFSMTDIGGYASTIGADITPINKQSICDDGWGDTHTFVMGSNDYYRK